ncbi:MAG: CRISPR-associated protein Cas4 [Anaerolineales bacterium]|nr:CRISPR-associated protein Cas4 [Anaerolineales bacterium]MCX7609073.1 CRISPR-associated protein Cas4 [Anaerolineales bacterium]MDW8226341.1 CRISPR-associated protein Cas4 [Anaerolineales bacterium]
MSGSLYLGLFLLLLAGILLLVSALKQKATGLPGGRIIYTDTRGWGKVEKPLYDLELGLTGKPDYIQEQNGFLIPIEVKTGRTPEAPYDSHIFQLAAYCYLIHKTYHKRPPYGILHYPERNFAVDYTPELESALLDLIAEMRIAERRGTVSRSHDQPGRCRHCGYRAECDERLE